MKLAHWFKRILMVFGIRAFQLYYFEKDLQEPITPITSSIPLQIRKATRGDIKKLLAIVRADVGIRIQSHQKHSSICVIAWHKEQIAGYTWLNKKEILLDGVRIGPVCTEGVFAHGGYVFPEFRGKKVFECLIAACYKKMQQQGYRFVGNLLDVHNLPVIHARERFEVKRKRIFVILLPFNLHITIGKPIGEGKLILQ